MRWVGKVGSIGSSGMSLAGVRAQGSPRIHYGYLLMTLPLIPSRKKTSFQFPQ